jgi:hypothetical protein
MKSAWALVAIAVLLGVPSCGGSQQETPARSPTQDYPPPPLSDAQGNIIGADNVRPQDRLRESPRIGEEGPIAAEQPGHRKGEPKKPKPPDPCQQIGLHDPDGSSHCK